MADATLAGVDAPDTGTARGVDATGATERGEEGADIPPGEIFPKKLLISPKVNPSFCIISRMAESPISIDRIFAYFEYLSSPPPTTEARDDIGI